MARWAMAFLTALDSRAAVKGSRDPLGAQSVWVRFGRYVVGNLTTQSTLLRDFTVLLVGLHLCERVEQEKQAGVSDLEVFVRWEQLAAYSRHLGGVGGFRGVERARRVSDSSTVTLSSSPRDQILGDQKVYGIWGLYMVAARTSGLVIDGTPRLTPSGRELVEQALVPVISRGSPGLYDRLVRLLGRSEPLTLYLRGRDSDFATNTLRILAGKLTPAETDIYRRHLIRGGPIDATSGLQRELAALFLDHPDIALGPAAVRALAKAARARSGKDSLLAMRLERIRACEAVLAPAALIFGWLLGQARRSRDDIVKDLRGAIGKGVAAIDPAELDELRDDLAAAAGGDGCERWIGIGRALNNGDAGAVVDQLLAHNRAVMRIRNGSSPWAEFDANALDVHFAEEATELFGRSDVPSLWSNSYFIESLRTVLNQVETRQ